MPELGAGIEVIETANPRTYYDQTRRKLGMVMGVEATPGAGSVGTDFRTSLPNLFIVGDTVTQPNIEKVIEGALRLADHLTH